MEALADRFPERDAVRGASVGRLARPGAPDRLRSKWNVLAEELVPFVPEAVAATNPGLYALPDLQRSPRPEHRTRRPHPAVDRSKARLAPAAPHPAAADWTRGLRRLLPGAATLAVLGGLWFGAGSLSSLHQSRPVALAGAVQTASSQLYLVRPGDTLWAIAARVEPGSDPRILVSRLEQQLHGAMLVPGDRLLLP